MCLRTSRLGTEHADTGIVDHFTYGTYPFSKVLRALKCVYRWKGIIQERKNLRRFSS